MNHAKLIMSWPCQKLVTKFLDWPQKAGTAWIHINKTLPWQTISQIRLQRCFGGLEVYIQDWAMLTVIARRSCRKNYKKLWLLKTDSVQSPKSPNSGCQSSKMQNQWSLKGMEASTSVVSGCIGGSFQCSRYEMASKTDQIGQKLTYQNCNEPLLAC